MTVPPAATSIRAGRAVVIGVATVPPSEGQPPVLDQVRRAAGEGADAVLVEGPGLAAASVAVLTALRTEATVPLVVAAPVQAAVAVAVEARLDGIAIPAAGLDDVGRLLAGSPCDVHLHAADPGQLRAAAARAVAEGIRADRLTLVVGPSGGAVHGGDLATVVEHLAGRGRRVAVRLPVAAASPRAEPLPEEEAVGALVGAATVALAAGATALVTDRPRSARRVVEVVGAIAAAGQPVATEA